jgi:hypothetical protein
MDSTEAGREEAELTEKFLQRLLELGILTEIKPPLPPDAIPRDRTPIAVEGNAISELIMRERR